MHREVILEVGAEGGSLTLLREVNATGEWKFLFARDEATLDHMLPEEDRGPKEDYSSQIEYIDSLEAALILLDTYPWFRLHPLRVHPEFLDPILIEVRKRGGPSAEVRWRSELAHSRKWTLL